MRRRTHIRRLLSCLAILAVALMLLPQLAHAATPPGPCHAGRDGETWSDPDEPGAGGEYRCTKPMPGFPGAGEWGWYKVFPPFTRHPADPTPSANGRPVLESASIQYELRYDAVTSYQVSVRQDPGRALTLVMDYGDGSSETVRIPQGTGTTVVAFSHSFYHPPVQNGPSAGHYTQTVTILETVFSDSSVTVHAC